jgi:type IV pilus assembly protein PilA
MVKRNGFTLIELLVVVAIIGILAAVGTVAYTGYTTSAKMGTTKSNHATATKYIAAIIAKCNIDGSVDLKYKYKDTTKYNVNCYPNKWTFFADYLINDMDNQGRWKNPYKASGNRVQQGGFCNSASSGDANVGFVWINGRDTMDHVTICTCFKTPCNSIDNRLESKIYLD